jgi:hypothetical protein
MGILPVFGLQDAFALLHSSACASFLATFFHILRESLSFAEGFKSSDGHSFGDPINGWNGTSGYASTFEASSFCGRYLAFFVCTSLDSFFG